MKLPGTPVRDGVDFLSGIYVSDRFDRVFSVNLTRHLLNSFSVCMPHSRLQVGQGDLGVKPGPPAFLSVEGFAPGASALWTPVVGIGFVPSAPTSAILSCPGP